MLAKNLYKRGIETTMNLKEKAKNLPLSPGVYLMKDSHGNIIYVGKSKKLKNRVQSYFQKSKNHSKKVVKLVHQIKDFEYILTDTEFEAFLLECKLIKELQPFYNKLMKSPQSYTYIVIRMDQELDRIVLSNHLLENDNYLYFGPFTSKNSAEKAILGLKEFLKIACSHSIYNNSPCLNYSLGLCVGMCFKKSALEQYHNNINRIIALFEGTDNSIIDEMNQKMIHASENFDYERASMIRDYLEAIHSLLKKEKVIDFTKEMNNIVFIESISDYLQKLFLIKGNKVLFTHLYKLDKTNIKRLVFEIKSKILVYFKKDTYPSSIISKDEIDEAQIIYSYLTSSPCKYLIIPESWFSIENRERLDLAIEELLLLNLEKMVK